MADLFGLGDILGGNTFEQQIELIDKQMEAINDNPELADPEKERQIIQLELDREKIVMAMEEDQAHDRGPDLFGD